MTRRTTMRDSANKQAQPPDTAGATSLASVTLTHGGGRTGREFHLGVNPVVTMDYDDDEVVTIHLTFTDRTTEVKVSWAMSNQDAKLLGNRL